MPDLASVFDDAGVSPEAREYIKARGITSIAVMALLAKDDATFQTTFVQKFITGIKIDGTDHKFNGTAEEQEVMEATLLAARQLSAALYRDFMAQTVPPPPLPFAAAAAAVPAAQSSKVPLLLPPGVWAAQVSRYNSIQLGGVDRKFKTELLVGAERALARIHHEHTSSHMYTPVRKQFSVEEGLFTETDSRPWDPQGAIQVMDAIDAIRWAWILFELGDEDTINTYVDWFNRLIRTKRERLPQIKAMWLSAGWRLAIELRQGASFKDAAKNIKDDADWISNQLSQHIGPDRDGKGKGGRGRPDSREKGRGRGKQGGGSSAHGRQLQRQGTLEACNRYNIGKCTAPPGQCKYEHKCSYCDKPGHPAIECFNNPANKGGKNGRGRGGRGNARGRGDRSRSGRGNNGDQNEAGGASQTER